RIGVPRAEHFGVHELASALDVERENTQGCTAFLHRRGEPDPAVRDGRRRPARTGHGGLPHDVARLAPLERYVLLLRGPLTRRPAELGPALGANRAGSRSAQPEQRENDQARRLERPEFKPLRQVSGWPFKTSPPALERGQTTRGPTRETGDAEPP